VNAIPPSFPPAGGAAAAGEAVAQWAALAEAAAVVAALADITPERAEPDFAGRLAAAQGWRRIMAENGIADLAAIMEPGLAALLSVNDRGADPRPAALALWDEYRAAREAVLALLPQG
jgi:hypothetical protein